MARVDRQWINKLLQRHHNMWSWNNNGRVGKLAKPRRYFLVFFFLRAAPLHMDIPRLGVKLELQPLAYATITALPDLSLDCNLHHSSWQHWILNSLSEARDRTCILMDISQIGFHWATMGMRSHLLYSYCFCVLFKKTFLRG